MLTLETGSSFLRDRSRLERESGLLAEPSQPLVFERETDEEFRAKTSHLSLLPHRSAAGAPLAKSAADPGFYEGDTGYKIAEPLQDCLAAVMKQRKFAHIRVALVDLTGQKLMAPQFAGHLHQEQLFAASVAKIAVMLGAFQLRHDLQVTAGAGNFPTIGDLLARTRADWTATQADPGGTGQSLGGKLALRGKLLLSGQSKVGFGGKVVDRKTKQRKPIQAPGMPLLKSVIDETLVGRQLTVILNSSRDSNGAIAAQVKKFQKKSDAEAISGLGFLERLRIGMGGAVPVSNFAVSTVIGDLGFHYIASTLVQTGLFDPKRGGGLWLGADYWRTIWNGLPGIHPQSATAGSLAAFMTLLAQDRLVSPAASAEMRAMLEKPSGIPASTSWFRQALSAHPIRRVVAKVGLMAGADEVAFIDRDVRAAAPTSPGGVSSPQATRVRYVVAALRARKPAELISLVRELDKCILENNGVKTGVGMQL